MLAFCCYSSTALAGGYSFVTLILILSAGVLPQPWFKTKIIPLYKIVTMSRG